MYIDLYYTSKIYWNYKYINKQTCIVNYILYKLILFVLLY